jgi:hypothetical protein
MRPTSISPTKASPLLFRHAIPRTSSAELSGHYDPTTQLWVIETKAGFLPLVEASDPALLETATTTRVRQEGDDDDFTADQKLCATLLDTSTLTKVRQESADDDISTDETFIAASRLGTLAELATKTDVQQESDDEITASDLIELETRTLNNQEGIDDDWPRILLELQTKTFAAVEQDDDCSLAH